MTHLRLNLYENAIDSIKHAIEHYVEDPVETRRYKYAILHLAQGVALLLKERLSLEHPNLIYKEVTNSEGQTVDVETSIIRLRKIANVDLGNAETTIGELSKLRNSIEHFAVNITKQQADNIIGRIVPFLANFAQQELKHNIQYEIGEEAWRNLTTIQGYRQSAILAAKHRIDVEHLTPHFCENCQDDTAIEQDLPYRRNDDIKTIVCQVCLGTYFVVPLCRECGKRLDYQTRDPAGVISSQFCEKCRNNARKEFPGISLPDFVMAVRKEFGNSPELSYEHLDSLVSSVALQGPSSRPTKIQELFDYGIIDFAYDYDRTRFDTLSGSQNLPGYYHFYGTDRFKWAWKGTPRIARKGSVIKVAYIDSTKVAVRDVVVAFESGKLHRDMALEFGLSYVQIATALDYYYSHRQEIDKQIGARRPSGQPVDELSGIVDQQGDNIGLLGEN